MQKPHKRLDVWKLSMDLVAEVYQATEGFPKEQKYSLTAQIHRVAITIPMERIDKMISGLIRHQKSPNA